MSQLKTISISLYNRADYTKQVLDALLECSGIEDYFVLIKAEPAKTENRKLKKEIEDTIKVAKDFKHPNKKIIINETLLGCSKNIYSSIDYCFKNTDTNFHIHLEDDIVPSKDCLRFFEWSSNYYKDTKNIAVVTSYHKNKTIISNIKNIKPYSNLTQKHIWFTPWGWGTWRDRWLNTLSHKLYDLITDRLIPYSSWDTHMNDIIKKENLFQIYPLVSRTQNIGALNGVHCPSPKFHKERQWTHLFAEDHNVFETEFIEMEQKIGEPNE